MPSHKMHHFPSSFSLNSTPNFSSIRLQFIRISFSFIDLLSNNNNNITMDDKWVNSQLKTEHVGLEVPNFKSVPPPSLPPSPSSISPSYLAFPPGFSPIELLNSPFFISSPNEPLEKQDTWKFSEPTKQTDFSSERTATKFEYPSTHSFSSEMATTKPEMHSNSAPGSGYFNYTNASKSIRERRRSEDGYNWRKYGQKQMKGSENPRSYYKCSHLSCSMRKKVERSLDGHITEIVYKGSHNHPKPQFTRRTSSQSIHQPSSSCTNSVIFDQSVVTLGNPQMKPVSIQDSSVSVGEEDLEQTSQTGFSGGDDDDLGREAKRWKGENENDGYSISGSRTVGEPRVVVQTKSEIDILDDGYRWRKYGQKVVKGNPNPRSYYKCTAPGCSVRKHVERAAHDMKAVLTTYEGKHNHDVPVGRRSASYNMNRTSLNSITSNVTTPAPIRPSAVTSNPSSASFTNSLYNTSLPTSGNQEPFPLDMLLSPGSFGNSDFGRSMGSYTSHKQYSDAVYLAKDDNKDDSFLQSFLSKNF